MQSTQSLNSQSLNSNDVVGPGKYFYMLLGRLQMDLEYYFGNGHQNAKHLYYDTIEEHMAETKALLASFPKPYKPDWFSEKDIAKYEALLAS